MSQIKLNHLAIIMDGNRRWAKSKGLPTLEGHKKGYQKLKDVAKWCIEKEIKILTVYAFSTENWNRSPAEVKYLMELLHQALTIDTEEFQKNKVKVKVIGQKHRLPKKIQQATIQLEKTTENNHKLTLQIALSYGGRQEIVFAVNRLLEKKRKKITENDISKNIWTADVNDPDMIVRTSGEQRLSNFMAWQSAYSELMFIKKHWPEFNKSDLTKIVKKYEQRHRRYGK